MSDEIEDKDVREIVKNIKIEHPTLQERLERYRERRSTYEAKRLGRTGPASAPAQQRSSRTLHG
jgi:hypothetical protein